MAKAASSLENSNLRRHAGGCHCGAVRYEVTVDATHGSRCNCSICTKVSPLGALVKPAAFKLVEGEEALSTYVWGSGFSKRFFCKHCGVHCYGSGSADFLGGDFVSVNLNTIDDIDPCEVETIYWDGRNNNWQAGPRHAAWPMKHSDSDAA